MIRVEKMRATSSSVDRASTVTRFDFNGASYRILAQAYRLPNRSSAVRAPKLTGKDLMA